MNVKRTVAMVAGGGALAVWLAAAATSNPRPSFPVSPQGPAPIDIHGAALSAEITRLHERLHPSATPVKSRDLFRYAARSAPSRRADDAGATTAIAVPVPASAPAAPLIKLVGIAEDAGAAGPVRTAIVSGFGELFLVKEGDTIAARYHVISVSAAGADVTDLTDNSTVRLALK